METVAKTISFYLQIVFRIIFVSFYFNIF